MERESYVEQPAHSREQMVMAMAELKTSYMNNSEFSQYSYYGTRSLCGTTSSLLGADGDGYGRAKNKLHE
jgi:hypothetical protein